MFVVATPDQCRERNARRDAESAYRPETCVLTFYLVSAQQLIYTLWPPTNYSLENLLIRFEEPSSMVRWDSPLFSVPWDDQLPCDDIFQAAVGGKQRRPNQGVVQVIFLFTQHTPKPDMRSSHPRTDIETSYRCPPNPRANKQCNSVTNSYRSVLRIWLWRNSQIYPPRFRVETT